MRSEGQAIVRQLLPTLLLLAACGGPKPLGSTPGSAGDAAGAAAATGSAGSTGSAGTGGVDVGGAGATGFARDAGTTGIAGDAATDRAGTTGSAGASDGGAPDDGAVPDAPPPESGTAVPRYDGGIVGVINSGNWNETTIYPFSKRRMLVRDEGDPHLVLLDFGRPDPVVWKTRAEGPWARSMQLIGNNQILGGTSTGYQVFDYTTGTIVKTVGGFGNTQSAYRTANAETMLTRSGTTLDFLGKTDMIAHSISYPGYGYVRLARPTRNGTFLVPSDTKLFEGDANGNVLWSLSGPTGAGWGHVFEPLLMSDGNVILSTFFGRSLDVIDKTTHMITKRYGTAAIPNAAMFQLNAFGEFQILPNGNLITANWTSYGLTGIQVIEFSPAGDVVWFYKEDPMVFSAIQGVMVIDGMDPQYLHVQEISSDSTWQPVIPTP